jgi:hypothetical protein
MGAALKLKSNFMQAIISAYSKFGFNQSVSARKIACIKQISKIVFTVFTVFTSVIIYRKIKCLDLRRVPFSCNANHCSPVHITNCPSKGRAE